MTMKYLITLFHFLVYAACATFESPIFLNFVARFRERKKNNWKMVGNLQIIPGAVVCVEADLKGDIKIGLKTIVHPCAKILATAGPIVIGEANIIEELAVIENKSTETLVIGNNNVFEVGANIFAASIGDHNVFETKCYVGETVKIGNGCVFGAGTRVTQPTSVEDNSVYFGDPLKHRIAGERPTAQTLQIDFLSRILPNYHHVKNPVKKDS